MSCACSLGLVFSLSRAGMNEQEQGHGSDRTAVACHCQADAADPRFPARFKYKTCKLHRLMDDGKSKKSDVNRSEHWNSVRVTFNIPHDAARRLRRLAESADPALRELGITSVQFDGDQVITLTLSNCSSLTAPATANLILEKVSSASPPPPPNRSANSIPFGDTVCSENHTSHATSQSSLACESSRQVSAPSPVCEGRDGAAPLSVITGHHKSPAVTAAAAPHSRHRGEEEENRKSVCTVNAAQYLTTTATTLSEPPGSSLSYPPPSSSPSGLHSDSSVSCSGSASVTSITTVSAKSSPSHCVSAAIPAATSFAGVAVVPVPSDSDSDLSAGIFHSECNTNHAGHLGSVRTEPEGSDTVRTRDESSETGSITLPCEKFDGLNRLMSHMTDCKSRVVASDRVKANSEAGDSQAKGGSVMNCSEIENDDDEERIISPEQRSPDRDSSHRSSSSPSSTSTTTRTHPQGQESPADSPAHDMQLLCNTSVRQSSSSNDSPLREQNTSPSHHSDSGIASSTSQQEPDPVLRQAIHCNNSADEHNSDDEQHPDGHLKNSSSDHSDSYSSGSPWPSSPLTSLPVDEPASPGSQQQPIPVFKFSPKEVIADPVVQTTSPIVAHKEDCGGGGGDPLHVVVNGTSHSNCSDRDDTDSSHSSATPPHTSSVAPDAMSAPRPDQPDAMPDLCFNDGETRPSRQPIQPEPPPVTRQTHSVASGDHNYIVISERSVTDTRPNNHTRSRSNSGRAADESNSRIDQNHSDLSTRPNKRRKCSSSTSSDNMQTIGRSEVADRSSSSVSNNNNSSSGSRSAVDQRSAVCSSGSESVAIRTSCKFPITNGHTYEV